MTRIEWPYSPATFFERAIRLETPAYTLEIADGYAVAFLTIPQEPVPDELRDTIADRITAEFDAQLPVKHMDYRLEAPRTEQYYPDGRKGVAIHLQSSITVTGQLNPDIVVKAGTGAVLRDTRAERLAGEGAFRAVVVEAMPRDPLLGELLTSYRAAVRDPPDELVHLYEIRDALKKRFRSSTNTIEALGISRATWDRFGHLANGEPLDQGRHRGSHAGRNRPASRSELAEARELARALILAFAKYLSEGGNAP